MYFTTHQPFSKYLSEPSFPISSLTVFETLGRKDVTHNSEAES